MAWLALCVIHEAEEGEGQTIADMAQSVSIHVSSAIRQRLIKYL